MILRGLLAALGLAALVAAVALDRPERFAVTFPAGLVLVVVAAGAIAADAFPLRRRALACSILTLAAGLVLALRMWEVPAAAAVVALQVAALPWPLHAAATRPEPAS